MAATEGLSSTEKYKSYARDIGLVAGAQLAVAILHFARLPILTKWLGASAYGTWSLILVTVSLIVPVAMLGLGMTMVRFLAAEKDITKIREGFFSILFSVLAAGVLISLILVLCSDLLATSILGDITSSNLVKLAAFMVLTQVLSGVSLFFFRSFRQMKLYSVFFAAGAAVELGLMVYFLSLGWGLRGVVIGFLVSGALCTVIAISFVFRQIGFQFPKFTDLKGYLKYGLPLIPNDALLWIILASDRYLIGYFMEAKDIGIYSAACGLANIIYYFLSPIGMVLFPTISKSYDDGNLDLTKTYFKYSLKYLLMLSIPSAFGLSILASPLLRIFTTSEFASGSSTVPCVAFGLVIFVFHLISLYIFHMVKKTYWVARLLGIAAALNIGLNFLLIPHLGIFGAALASLIAYVTLGILTVVISFRYLRFNLGFSFIVKSVFASSIMTVVIWRLNPLGVTQVIVSILLGIIIYFAIILVLKGFSKKELYLLKDLVVFKRRSNQ